MIFRLYLALALLLGGALPAAAQIILSPSGSGGGAPGTATYITQTPDATLAAEQALSALDSGLMLNTTGTGVISIYGGSACGSGTDAVNSVSASGVVTCITPSGSGAPTTAKYIVQEADAGLSAEQSLGLLTTGLTLNTVTGSTGVLSTYGGTSCTNQFPRSLNASGAATCASVANTDLTNSSFSLNGNTIALGGSDTLVLASADFVNQGATTMVLHGNAAGNPSFGAIVTGDVTDAAITYAKIQNVTDARLLGRSSGSSGPPIEITVGSGLSLSAGALTATGGGGAAGLYGVANSTEVVNTTTETALATYTITANALGANGVAILDVLGDYLNNSGNARTLQIKVKFGATTIFDDVTFAMTENAGRRPFSMHFILSNLGVTNSQWLGGRLEMGTVTAPTAGLGEIGIVPANMNNQWMSAVGGSAAIDTTANATFAVTVIHSLANASLSIRAHKSFVRVLTP